MLRPRSSLGLLLTTLALAACSGGGGSGTTPLAGDGEFESASPGANTTPNKGSGAGGASGELGSAPPPGTADPGSGDDGAGRAIEEADIIQIHEGRLYALSRYGGLSVVDVSRRDRLSLLGRHKVVATPFEMYVRDGVVFALYQGFGQYEHDAEADQWVYYQTSQVVAIDARDPGAMTEIGRFAIPGEITDSRIVGDILYVAAFENGQCWGCEEGRPRTNVLSLDVTVPAAISKVDEISVEERQDGWSWRRSLSATNQRLYLAGPTWGSSDQPTGSTIQVIDISDPTGDLREGTSVTVSGQIQSRWQMDEHEGVLRVVSQPFTWALESPPAVETFTVESSDSITRLGSTSLVLPRPEQLQSVRFDGTRAYAVTFERTDPLFTIDLQDPATPRQMGELEMPGWLYHMEPRGDRLLGLGYDQGNPEGAITVSLFDVTDLSRPVMLSRVNFGGDWGNLAEDQNQIHKAFTVLDGAGLILVPFSGYSYRTSSDDECGFGKYLSGVQLVDFAGDTLTLRGVAGARGQARRGFIHDERLFTMSDERVESFDITDRDAPVSTASLPLAQIVNHTQGAGNKVIRVGNNWYSQTLELDVTTLAGAGSPSALGRLEIPQLSQNSCYKSSWLGDVHSSEDAAYLFYTQYSFDPGRQETNQSTRVVTIDVTDPSAPSVAADAELDFIPAYPSYIVGAVNSGASTVNRGPTFAIANREYSHTGDRPAVTRSELKVVDLSDPAAPAVTTVALPKSFGATGLLLSGNVVATSQFQPTTDDFSRGRFYLERVDVSDPRAPVRAPSVNIPGSLLYYDAERSRAVTVDYRRVVVDDVTPRVCVDEYRSFDFTHANEPNFDYEKTPVQCRAILHILRLVQVDGDRAIVLDTHELGPGEHVSNFAAGTDRLFLLLGDTYGLRGPAIGGVGYGGWFSSGILPLITVGFDSDALEVGRLELETGDQWWGSRPLVASGHRAALSTGFGGKLTVVDAREAARPSILREVEIPGYVSELDVVGDTAIASLGYDGVATVPLAP